MKKVEETALWTALVTPMNHDETIDYEGLESLVRRQEQAGNGILLLGSTGEGLALTREEKLDVIDFVTAMDPDVPLMAGVGGFQESEQREWIEQCNATRIDAFLMVSPLYAKPGPKGMIAWFRSLLDTAGRPCMLYNIPSRTGSRILPSVMRELAKHPRLWSLKEASGNLETYQEFLEHVPGLPLYSGDDAQLPIYAEVGCNGLVSVAANVWPEATHLYVDRTLRGESSSFRELWQKASDLLFSAPNPVPVKRLLAQKKWIGSDQLRLPLLSSELETMDPLLDADREIRQWVQESR
ncbi:MAG: 4-hydroxy-tetrahydrodipicolinate synthase [Balneolaceae bacterium]